MNDYLASSLLWSMCGLVIGVLVGYELRFQIDHLFIQEEDIVTTPERLKRRQMIEGSGLLILGIITVMMSVYFRHQGDVQRTCLSEYIKANSQTSQVRAELVNRESQATRTLITSSLSVKSVADFRKVRRTYLHDIHEIDVARAEHPIVEFKGCP